MNSWFGDPFTWALTLCQFIYKKIHEFMYELSIQLSSHTVPASSYEVRFMNSLMEDPLSWAHYTVSISSCKKSKNFVKG